MTKEIALSRMNEIVEHSHTYDYCEFEIIANDWQNYGKDRTYFSIAEKSTDTKVSKHYKVKKYGYLDNTTGKYYPEKYGNLNDNFDFGGSKF